MPLKFGLINTRALKSKENLLKEENLDIIGITETWLNNTDDNKVWCKTSKFNRDNLNLDTVNREERGGIALVWRDPITSRQYGHGIKNTFEYGIWELKTGTSQFNRYIIPHTK